MKVLAVFLIVSCTYSLSFTQSETILKEDLEGMRVEVLIDMPASSEGIDIYADKPRKMDFDDYSSRIKKYGISIFPGNVVMITKIKKKKKHIEFHLAGGGYGTFGDESGTVSARNIPKTSRQETIEKQLKDDKDKKLSNRSKLEAELKDLKRVRSIAQEESRRQASLESEIKRARIQEQRLQGGSRFNIRFDHKIGSEDLTTRGLIEVLGEYVNFKPGNTSDSGSGSDTKPNSSIRKGMTMEETMALMGIPTSLNTINECGLEITKCTFEDSTQKVEATFAEKVLVKYAVMSR